MKIMISAEKPDLTARVGHLLGTSPYLIIVDTQTMAFEAVPNPAADNQQGSAGVTAVVLAIGRDVNAVLTGYCRLAATQHLTENGIEVVTGISATAADAVEQYKMRELHDLGDASGKIKPGKTPVDRSGKIILNIAVPIALVFCLMVVINRYLKPTHIAKFLGKRAGIKDK